MHFYVLHFLVLQFRVLQFQVLQFHALHIGPPFSCLAFSCPAILMVPSVIFMSVIFSQPDTGTMRGVGRGPGYPLPSRLGGLGSVVSSPSGVRGGAPAANAFLAYFRVTERLYQKEKCNIFCPTFSVRLKLTPRPKFSATIGEVVLIQWRG